MGGKQRLRELSAKMDDLKLKVCNLIYASFVFKTPFALHVIFKCLAHRRAGGRKTDGRERKR